MSKKTSSYCNLYYKSGLTTACVPKNSFLTLLSQKMNYTCTIIFTENYVEVDMLQREKIPITKIHNVDTIISDQITKKPYSNFYAIVGGVIGFFLLSIFGFFIGLMFGFIGRNVTKKVAILRFDYSENNKVEIYSFNSNDIFEIANRLKQANISSSLKPSLDILIDNFRKRKLSVN
jgi:hypothetical protein